MNVPQRSIQDISMRLQIASNSNNTMQRKVSDAIVNCDYSRKISFWDNLQYLQEDTGTKYLEIV